MADGGVIVFKNAPAVTEAEFALSADFSWNERMRLDSAGNLLVGTTTTNSDVAGHVMYGGALAGVSTQSAATRPLYINRLSSDGDIIELAKDGTTVGSIGVQSGDNLFISATTGGGAGLQFWGAGGTSPVISPMKEGATADAQVNLGRSSERFKDAHFSGVVHAQGFQQTWKFIDMTALDFNNFYPVSLEGGDSTTLNNFELFKYYGNYNPVVNGTTMLGGVALKMDMSGYSWGGNVIHNYVHFAHSQYRAMVGAVTLRGYYKPVLWLRGGYGYHYRSDTAAINPVVYTTKTTLGGTGYSYYLGPITASAMGAKADYLGTTHNLGTFYGDTLCHNWYT